MEIENTAIRLRKIMDIKNLKQSELLKLTEPFCNKYNVKMNKSDISQYLAGKTKPNQYKLAILSMVLDVNESWLIGYDVPMERTNTSFNNELSKDKKHLIEIYEKLNDIGKKEATKRIEELSQIPQYYNDPKTLQDLNPVLLAAHNDDLSEEENNEADKRILEAIKNMK